MAMVKMGYVWDRTVEFLGDTLGVLMPIIILAIFVPLSFWNSLGPLWPTATPDMKMVLVTCYLVLAVVLMWGYLAISALAVDPSLRRRAAPVALQRLLPALAIYLALGLAVFVLVLPFSAILATSGVDIAAMQQGRPTGPIPPAHGWALLLYLIFFLVVVVALWARLAPLTAVLVAERRGAGAPLRAFRLTRRLTWKLIGVMILYAVVSQVAALAARGVFGSVLKFFAGGDGPVNVASVITAVIVAAVSTGFTVLAAAFCAKLYVAVVRAGDVAIATSDPTPA